jgi:hypothetical protein
MPTRDELGDLLAVPTTPLFSTCATNGALAAAYASLAPLEELDLVWEILREGFGRGWAAYFTAAGGDRGLRVGLRMPGRRAEFVVAKIHMTTQGIKFSSGPSFGKYNRERICGPDGLKSTALDGFLAALPVLPARRRTGPFFDPTYDHGQVMAAAVGLLPRDHPPGRDA